MPPSSSTGSTATRWTLAVGKARYGLMLREDGFVMDDGTTSRLAERPLPHDHDDRECRQRDAASGILPSGAVAATRRADGLGHGAMGAVLRRGAALARRAAQRRRRAVRLSQRGVPVSRRARPSRSAAASRRGCSASRSRASWPTSWPCRRAMATRAIRAIMAAGERLRHRALRHRGARRDAHRERATSPATRSTARPPRAISASAA